MAGLAAGAERIVIDTDCGYLGDDGVTIAMLLRRPDLFRVEGVTTVTGNVWARQSAGYVLDILKLLKRTRVPVYVGAEEPLVRTAASTAAEPDVEFRGAFEEKAPAEMPAGVRAENGVSYLIRTIEQNAGEITIVALGPMTNLAMALRLRPGIAGKIRRLVFMGGQYRAAGNASKQAEFNFWFDPEAAQAVLQSGIREKVMFGLDICNKAMLDQAGFAGIASARTPLAARFRQDYGVRYPGFLKNPDARVSVWDMLVAAWMIDPALFGGEETRTLDVDVRRGPSYGKVIDGVDGSAVSLWNDVDYPKVYDMIRSAMVAE